MVSLSCCILHVSLYKEEIHGTFPSRHNLTNIKSWMTHRFYIFPSMNHKREKCLNKVEEDLKCFSFYFQSGTDFIKFFAL